MGYHRFPKVFPYFFPLAVFTLRTIWYIWYILKTDLNLMIPDVVVWQLMDRDKQIRIPHPPPSILPGLPVGESIALRMHPDGCGRKAILLKLSDSNPPKCNSPLSFGQRGVFYRKQYKAKVSRAVFLSSGLSPAINKRSNTTIKSPVSKSFGSSCRRKPPILPAGGGRCSKIGGGQGASCGGGV